MNLQNRCRHWRLVVVHVRVMFVSKRHNLPAFPLFRGMPESISSIVVFIPMPRFTSATLAIRDLRVFALHLTIYDSRSLGS